MNRYADQYKRLYPKVFGSVIMFIIMSGYLIIRSDKSREEFIYQKGTITYLSQTHPLRPQSKPRPKDVYLILDEYERIFEMFVGEDKGDFSPRVNRLSELKVGDEVEIYFEETIKTRTQPVNRLLQYLDRDEQLYYLRSKVDKYIGYFILGGSRILLMLGIYMKIKSN